MRGIPSKSERGLYRLPCNGKVASAAIELQVFFIPARSSKLFLMRTSNFGTEIESFMIN